MQINSLDEAMEILQHDSPLSQKHAATGEDISIDNVLDNSGDYVTDSELAFYLSSVIEDIGYTKAEVLEKAGVTEVTGFQLFAGISRPTFNTLIRICLGAGFTLDETQHAIELAGYKPLVQTNPRDAIIIRAIIHMKNIKDVVHELYEINQTIL